MVNFNASNQMNSLNSEDLNKLILEAENVPNNRRLVLLSSLNPSDLAIATKSSAVLKESTMNNALWKSLFERITNSDSTDEVSNKVLKSSVIILFTALSVFHKKQQKIENERVLLNQRLQEYRSGYQWSVDVVTPGILENLKIQNECEERALESAVYSMYQQAFLKKNFYLLTYLNFALGDKLLKKKESVHYVLFAIGDTGIRDCFAEILMNPNEEQKQRELQILRSIIGELEIKYKVPDNSSAACYPEMFDFQFQASKAYQHAIESKNNQLMELIILNSLIDEIRQVDVVVDITTNYLLRCKVNDFAIQDELESLSHAFSIFPENKKIKELLAYRLTNSVKENKLHDAQSIMRCYGRDYPISELHSLKNMFKMAVNKMNNELACYLRGLAEMSFEKWELDSMYDGLKHRGSGADEVRRLVKNMYPQQNGCVIS